MEFALVLPLLLLMALALVQVGILIRDQLVLVEAARAGAREAAVSDAAGDIQTAVDGAAGSLDVENVSSEVDRTGGRGDPVTVKLSYAAAIRIPFVAWLFPDRITLLASATMRQEFG